MAYLQRAAEYAAQRHATREATAHLRNALALLDGLPADRIGEAGNLVKLTPAEWNVLVRAIKAGELTEA